MLPVIEISIGVALLYLVLRWDVFADFNKWVKNIPVKHRSEWLIRVLLVSPVIVLLYMAHPDQGIWPVICTAIMVGSVWWLCFDGWYNWKRRTYLKNTGASYNYYKQFTWWFTGSDDGLSDSKLDRFQYWIGPILSKVVKVVLVVLTISVYVLTSF